MINYKCCGAQGSACIIRRGCDELCVTAVAFAHILSVFAISQCLYTPYMVPLRYHLAMIDLAVVLRICAYSIMLCCVQCEILHHSLYSNGLKYVRLWGALRPSYAQCIFLLLTDVLSSSHSVSRTAIFDYLRAVYLTDIHKGTVEVDSMLIFEDESFKAYGAAMTWVSVRKFAAASAFARFTSQRERSSGLKVNVQSDRAWLNFEVGPSLFTETQS